MCRPGRRIELPLLKDVGWAIIDYVRHGRPACACPEATWMVPLCESIPPTDRAWSSLVLFVMLVLPFVPDG